MERGIVAEIVGIVDQNNRITDEREPLTDHGLKTGKTTPMDPSLIGLQIGKHYPYRCAEVTELDSP